MTNETVMRNRNVTLLYIIARLWKLKLMKTSSTAESRIRDKFKHCVCVTFIVSQVVESNLVEREDPEYRLLLLALFCLFHLSRRKYDS